MYQEQQNQTVEHADIDNIFDNWIKDGYKSKEVEVLPDFRVQLRALSPNELCKAESEINERNRNVPADVTIKLRCAKILSYAIIKINGVYIVSDDMTYEQRQERRFDLYVKLMRSPIVLIQKTYDLYVRTVREESEYYQGNVTEEILDFFEPTGETSSAPSSLKSEA